MVLGWFHCRQREQQVPMSCGKTEHGWEESQQGWFVKIWRMFYGLRWGWGHRQRKGHRKSGYWYLSWDQWEIVVEPSTGQQQKYVLKSCHGLGWKGESCGSDSKVSAYNISPAGFPLIHALSSHETLVPAVLSVCNGTIPTPYPLFILWQNIPNTKFTILTNLSIYFISIKQFHIVMQTYRTLHKFVYHPWTEAMLTVLFQF